MSYNEKLFKVILYMLFFNKIKNKLFVKYIFLFRSFEIFVKLQNVYNLLFY